MDVSLKETSICVVDGSGRMVSEGTVISEPSATAAFIEAKAGSAVRIGLETGSTALSPAKIGHTTLSVRFCERANNRPDGLSCRCRPSCPLS